MTLELTAERRAEIIEIWQTLINEYEQTRIMLIAEYREADTPADKLKALQGIELQIELIEACKQRILLAKEQTHA